MKISSIYLKEEIRGISPFKQDDLGEVVILAGGNGSGKTRLLDLICEYINKGENKDALEILVSDRAGILEHSNKIKQIKIANYSHYDAILQSPRDYPTYVIGQAKELLEECDYEETALNALLVIQDIAYGYSEEFKNKEIFQKFQKTVNERFGILIEKTESGLKMFGREMEEANLSPGQIYLLRIAVACEFNKKRDDLIFVLDEPEMHLHPKAMIDMITYMRRCFEKCQFWISTHSVELISYLTATEENTTVLCMNQGRVGLLRSDSSEIITGLLGHNDNRLYLQQFYATPEVYASLRFAIECFLKPETKSGKKKDRQQQLITPLLKKGITIVDYGTGQGRLLEQIVLDSPEAIKNIQYFAYDIDPKYADKCKKIMRKNNIKIENYSNNLMEIQKLVNERADYVFLVNVLHEIPPDCWEEVFVNIVGLLQEKGKLCIVEREELTIGERANSNGFLMVTEQSIRKMFKNYERIEHEENKYLVRYLIDKKDIVCVNKNKIKQAIKEIETEALTKIEKLREETDNNTTKKNYKLGLRLQFWLNQYANAALAKKTVSQNKRGE